ncbi:tyrosine-type recombinase/integrase [Actinoplanes couchii]|uniref:Transposase/phage integrase n=1 Tax=Actinoplanes couchii TaxID=403638 RepID=A0ABQ3XPL0_9ACTN|nr:tyrosine-type recombinase/integrase [Actinoplanes couchii]MDR6319103.1 integrase [Actinoplanes couchii]GID60444.1 putative transposase/phage integrase [Actinoplanes couchii]
MRSDALRVAPTPASTDALGRLLADLPVEWQGEVIGPGIDGWHDRTEKGRAASLRLAGLPPRLRTELAWMAHWQFRDGIGVSVSDFNQAATALAWAITSGREHPTSMAALDKDTFMRLYRTSFESRRGRLPSQESADRFGRVLFGYPQMALIARLNDRPWWVLDNWHPRCDPRIPVRDREPRRSEGCSPGKAEIPWVRDAIKWFAGTMLESGTKTWSTITGGSMLFLLMFDRWLSTTAEPASLTRDSVKAGALASSFRRWLSDPANRPRTLGQSVSQRAVNDGIRTVSDMMAFIVENRDECRTILGPSPWDDLTEIQPAVWRKQITRSRGAKPLVNEEHYVDDHTLGQITTALPTLGQNNPQAMRMLLLQILTGRRASEICMCDFDCLSPATGKAIETAEGEQVARFRYAQSKIDQAPDTILVDAEVVAVVEEQQQWVRDRFPGTRPSYLFPQQHANAHGTKHSSATNYGRILREFSEQVNITDSKGRPVRLSKTHRFRHTRITRLAELGLPVHVLQRYAGHSNPTMSMHYVARREEHSEQAFLATRKFKADGTAVTFSREDHDGMQLFNRADRFLPHGYCLLPPLQTCDKGNACLTCSVFVTDSSHLDTLQRQLDESEALIERQTSAFQARHGRPMPADNVWLLQRTAERDSLTKLLTAMRDNPGRPCQGAGSPTSGPTPITIDTIRHRQARS